MFYLILFLYLSCLYLTFWTYRIQFSNFLNSFICYFQHLWQFWVSFCWLVYFLLWLILSYFFAYLINVCAAYCGFYFAGCWIFLYPVFLSFVLGYHKIIWKQFDPFRFCLLGRTRRVFHLGLFVHHYCGETLLYTLFSVPGILKFCYLSGVGIAAMPSEHRALLVISGHSFLSLEQFPTCVYWTLEGEPVKIFSVPSPLWYFLLWTVATLVFLDSLHNLLSLPSSAAYTLSQGSKLGQSAIGLTS